MNKLSIIAVLMLATLVISIAPVFATPTIQTPHNADAMWVEPTPINLNTTAWHVGDKFNVTVAANMTENTFAWQVVMYYNSTQLTPTNVYVKLAPATAGNFPCSLFMANSNINTGVTVNTAINPGAYPPIGDLKSVLASETLSAPDYEPGPNSGILCIITFQIAAAPGKLGIFNSTFDISYEYGLTNTYFWDPAGHPIQFTPYDGVYSYTWIGPTTLPHMGIEHDNGFGVTMSTSPLPNVWPVTWGPSPPNVTGSGFTASLYIKNLDAAWGLWNASFTLTYNSTVISVVGGTANITIDSNWVGANVKTDTEVADTGTITIYVENYTGLIPATPNKVLVGTVKFTVMIMGACPPLPAGYYDDSLLTYSAVTFFDAPSPGPGIPITPDPSDHGEVKIYGMIALPLPYLKVVPTTTVFGPAPAIGSTFTVKVQVVNMSSHWYDVGVQFRLQYDSAWLSFVSAHMGAYITDPQWDLYGDFHWFFNDLADPTFGDNVIGFVFVFPNTTSGVYDQPFLPNTLGDFGANASADITAATVTFKVINQNCFDGANVTTFLNIPPFWLPSDAIFIDKDANYIPSTDCKNATVTIKALNEVNRQMDLVGGAVNDGYGVLTGAWPFPYPAPSYYTGTPAYLAFPKPFGGQGPNTPMDLVFPQSLVYLNAYVTYNYWPVQTKDVGFEIEGPYYKLTTDINGGLLYNASGYLLYDATNGPVYIKELGQTFYNATGNGIVVTLLNSYKIWAKLTATTDANGVATLPYRMPWPCNDPDSITGVWLITATVTVADQVVTDTMHFYYQRLIYITSVTTDSYAYVHDQCVKVTVDYQTHSQQLYQALFSVVLEDNLSVPFGFQTYNTTSPIAVGGAIWCTWLTGEFTVEICIPKWAYAGNGFVLVSVYDKDPTEGGEALAPTYTPYPIINIEPY